MQPGHIWCSPLFIDMALEASSAAPRTDVAHMLAVVCFGPSSGCEAMESRSMLYATVTLLGR